MAVGVQLETVAPGFGEGGRSGQEGPARVPWGHGSYCCPPPAEPWEGRALPHWGLDAPHTPMGWGSIPRPSQGHYAGLEFRSPE